ncbi:zinc finger, CCHC-type containing protein [Tanacetum coccineum]
MDLMHSTPSMYYDYDAYVNGELLVIMKNSQSVNLLIFISNTLIELFNDFGSNRDGILKRPTIYFNLWRYKVVRHRLNTSAGNPVKEILLKLNLPDHRILKDGGEDFRYSDTVRLSRSDEVLKTKEFQRSFHYSDTVRISRSNKVLKLKNFKKDATLKLFKSTNQESLSFLPVICFITHSRQPPWETKILSVLYETTPNLATRAIGIPLSSPQGTTWYLFDPTPSGWCKMDAHSRSCPRDPKQTTRDFVKLMDSLDLDGSITTWEDLTTRFLTQFFPPGRTAKLRNDILMFQQHHGESLSEAWTRFKDLLQKVSHHGIDCPSPQPQALETTFEDRIRDYMAAHTGKIERFKNAIFKQREGINSRITKMFRLLKELTTNKTPEKVLIREEAIFLISL